MAKMLPIEKLCVKSGDMTMDLDLSRFEQQFQEAQFKLDSQIMTDMVPYMPMQTGTFINVTRAMSVAIAGSGKVVAAAPPYGRFLYEGKVMVDEATGSPWARPGAKKVVTDRNLDFSKAQHPKVTAKWFDAAKTYHGGAWIQLAKKTAGGG